MHNTNIVKFPAWALLTSLLALSANLSAKGIEVQTLEGKMGQFSEFLSKEKWTIVMVWTTYCGVCKQEYPKIADFHQRHQENDAVVLGISLDGFGEGEKVLAYRQKHLHNFPSVLSNAGDFTEPYEKTTGSNFSGTPTYLLFDQNQKLQGFKNGILAIKELESFLAEYVAPDQS